MKAYGEVSGSSTIQGRAKATADAIAAQLKVAAEKQGCDLAHRWLSADADPGRASLPRPGDRAAPPPPRR